MSKYNIHCGAVILDLKYSSIIILAYVTVAVALWNILYSIYLISFAINTNQDVGDYINMITVNDGTVIPLLLLFPAVICIIINITAFYLVYKAFDRNQKPNMNKLMYSFILICIISIFIILLIIMMILIRILSSPHTLHNGIIKAMNNYRSDSLIKNQIDSLQIQFQCCGSTMYKEWYEIEWYDTNLINKVDENEYKYQAPFSCCSMKSIYPCIHHNIESRSLPYKYIKEQNFSLSTNGCFKAVVQLKKQIGLDIIGRLLIILFTQLLMIVGVRLLQTAHSFTHVLHCKNAIYTCWLFGYYTGDNKCESCRLVPPPVPPIPKELMDD